MNWTWRNYILPNKHGEANNTHREPNVSARYEYQEYTLPHRYTYIQFNFCLSSLICAWMHCLCVRVWLSWPLWVCECLYLCVLDCMHEWQDTAGNAKRKSPTPKSPCGLHLTNEGPPPSQHLFLGAWDPIPCDPGHCSYLTAVVGSCQFGDLCGNKQNNYRKCRL